MLQYKLWFVFFVQNVYLLQNENIVIHYCHIKISKNKSYFGTPMKLHAIFYINTNSREYNNFYWPHSSLHIYPSPFTPLLCRPTKITTPRARQTHKTHFKTRRDFQQLSPSLFLEKKAERGTISNTTFSQRVVRLLRKGV